MSAGGAADGEGTYQELDPEELTVLDHVGSGMTAEVFAGMYKGRKVAIKEILGDLEGLDEGTLLALQREIAIWPSVEHPNVVRFVGAVTEQTPLRFVSEFCAGGSLFDLLHNCWHIELSWWQRVKMLHDTANAMNFLHAFTPQIIHRDLKSLNLLLYEPVADKNTVPKVMLTDFGFARMKSCGSSEWSPLTKGAGTFHWMAPEVIDSMKYDEKSDVYSFAMIIYECVCRRVPFEDQNPQSVQDLCLQKIRPSLGSDWVPNDAPTVLIDLMKQCWDHDPAKRPPFKEIFPFLGSLLESQGMNG